MASANRQKEPFSVLRSSLLYGLLTGSSGSEDNPADLRTVLDSGSAACLKTSGTNSLLSITGGTFNLSATGPAGKLINAAGHLVIGDAAAATLPTDPSFSPDIQGATTGGRVWCTAVKQKYYGTLATAIATTNLDGLSLSIASDNLVTSSSSGGWGGPGGAGGGDDNADYSNPKGIKGEASVAMHSGRLRITTANEGGEGFESKGDMTIDGGILELVCADDCINTAGNLTIDGGWLYCGSTGNDAIDSNGNISINGGVTLAFTATSPECGIDLDNRSGLLINGGIVVSMGSATQMAYGSSGTQKSYLSTSVSASTYAGKYLVLSPGTATVYAKNPPWPPAPVPSPSCVPTTAGPRPKPLQPPARRQPPAIPVSTAFMSSNDPERRKTMVFRSVLEIGFALSLSSVAALAQGPGGGGFNPGGGGGGPGGGGSSGSFAYDAISSDTTNADHTVIRTDGGLLYRFAASPDAVTAPASVTAIADGLFAGCTNLATADLSATFITALPADCFAGCTALTTVILPSTCTAIGPNAFAGCTSLSSVTAPAVATVGADAFRGCTALTDLPDFAAGAAIGDYAFAATGLTTIDATGLILAPGAFSGCTFLSSASGTSADLPDALFSGCTGLAFDPSACTSIGRAALAGVSYGTIPLASGVLLSGYAFAADAATVDTLLDTADATAFDPSSLAFLGRTLSYDTGNGLARIEAASLVAWLAAEAANADSPVGQPASYATSDLETWLADADNAAALVDYTGASLTVSGDTFLYTPPRVTATSLTVSLEGATDLQSGDAWSTDTLTFSSTGGDGTETYITTPTEASTDAGTPSTPSRAFARLTFVPAW